MDPRDDRPDRAPAPARRRSRRPAPAEPVEATGSPSRAAGLGLFAAALVALILVVFGGPLSMTAGLLVVAFFLGRIVGGGVRLGAGATLSSPARVSLAIVLALVGVALGQIGIWVFAESQGGRLAIGQFLLDTYGPLVPLEFLVAAGSAWWATR